MTPDYVSKSKKDLEMLIEKYDWLCYEAKQAQKLADSKSSFRGLCNIGNCKIIFEILSLLHEQFLPGTLHDQGVPTPSPQL